MVDVVTLGDPDGPGALAGVPVVSEFLPGLGYLVATPWTRPAELPRVFDANGRYVRTVGARGSGPGEFQVAEGFQRMGDSLWVLDSQLRRVTAMSLQSGESRYRQFEPFPQTLLPLGDGTLVLSTGMMGPGSPIRHVTMDGQQLSAFGDSVPEGELGFQWLRFASGTGNDFWSAPVVGQLKFQHWSAPGRLVRQIEVTRPWYQPYRVDLQGPTPTLPPKPTLTGFWIDRDGALWVVGMVADPEWAEGLGKPIQEGAQTRYPVESGERTFDTVIEQIDPDTGRTLASIRLDRAYGQVVAPWTIASTAQNADGWFTSTVSKVCLESSVATCRAVR